MPYQNIYNEQRGDNDHIKTTVVTVQDVISQTSPDSTEVKAGGMCCALTVVQMCRAL